MAIALALWIGPPRAQADQTPIKGKSGVVQMFDIKSVTSVGFVGVRQDTGLSYFVPWSLVDLDWLKTNQPALYQQLTLSDVPNNPFTKGMLPGAGLPPVPTGNTTAPVAATPAPAAPAPAVPPPPPPKPGPETVAQIAARLVKNWAGHPPAFANGAPTPDCYLAAGRAGILIQDMANTNDELHHAYTYFQHDVALQEAMKCSFDDAVQRLQAIKNRDNADQVETLVNSETELTAGLEDIDDSQNMVDQDAVQSLTDFLNTWLTASYGGSPTGH